MSVLEIQKTKEQKGNYKPKIKPKVAGTKVAKSRKAISDIISCFKSLSKEQKEMLMKNAPTIESRQYAVIIALMGDALSTTEIHYCLKRLGIKTSEQSLRRTLRHLENKGLIRRENDRYRIADGFTLEDLRKSIDFARVRSRLNQNRQKRKRKREVGKYAVTREEIMIKYNPHNIARHIGAHLRRGEYINAICEFLYISGGLRPTDIIKEVIILPNGEIIVIVYEKKTKRIRIVERFSAPLLIRLIKLLEEMEVYQQMLKILEERGQEILKEINENPRKHFDLCDIRLSRRIYLSYYGLDQAICLPHSIIEEYEREANIIIKPKEDEDEWSSGSTGSITNEQEDIIITKGICVGTHANTYNTEYYITKTEF